MRWLRALIARMLGVFRTRSHEESLNEELRAHLEMLAEDYVRRGRTPAEASREARLRLGGIDQTKEAVREVAPALRVTQVRTLDSMIETGARRERLLAWLSGAFGALALILAAVGLYGVVAYAAQRRTPEIGIRLALGARPSQIHTLLLREVIVLLAVGLTLGGAATVVFTVRLEPVLFDVTPQDPATFTFAMVLLGAIALVAGYIPARRAARLDPMQALRSE